MMDMSGQIVTSTGQIVDNNNINEEQISDSFFIKGNKKGAAPMSPGRNGKGMFDQKTGLLRGADMRNMDLQFETLIGYLTNEEMSTMWAVTNPHKPEKQSHFVYTINVSQNQSTLPRWSLLASKSDSQGEMFLIVCLQGVTNDGETFEVFRRFKEFSLLRKVFVTRFPALYVPPIPIKKALVNNPLCLLE